MATKSKKKLTDKQITDLLVADLDSQIEKAVRRQQFMTVVAEEARREGLSAVFENTFSRLTIS